MDEASERKEHSKSKSTCCLVHFHYNTDKDSRFTHPLMKQPVKICQNVFESNVKKKSPLSHCFFFSAVTLYSLLWSDKPKMKALLDCKTKDGDMLKGRRENDLKCIGSFRMTAGAPGLSGGPLEYIRMKKVDFLQDIGHPHRMFVSICHVKMVLKDNAVGNSSPLFW